MNRTLRSYLLGLAICTMVCAQPPKHFIEACIEGSMEGFIGHIKQIASGDTTKKPTKIDLVVAYFLTNHMVPAMIGSGLGISRCSGLPLIATGIGANLLTLIMNKGIYVQFGTQVDGQGREIAHATCSLLAGLAAGSVVRCGIDAILLADMRKLLFGG